ncbi:MAG: dicarboxylate/amino acid:cation symporter, partial [bacterium]|nr:dicarboxylate/amino acid:cation symporter [bacterium]
MKYLSGMAQALFTAFSTASSSATLPTTMECVEENNKISSRSASFVLPIGATINMDGTALYEAVAVIFIAQAYGIPMGATMLLVVFLTATLAAVGAAG